MSRGVCELLERHKKCVGEVSPYFQMELNAPGFLSSTKDKKNKEWSSICCWDVP
jgi:hypothetical protein